ncbi:hypothetical protein [Nocardia miyunensis]|uniref:hypothetical protein n=1 Tax=Nocardia miyunensis TaxID=282684 RepID=UPI0012F4E0AE|nr:hypothetical protein [Nocardia miyunensis]
MSYPQYPGGYQPYPQGQGMEPSSGTAMAAGVLASLGAAGQILGGALDIVVGSALPDFDDEVLRNSWFSGYLIGIGVIGLITAGLLGTGAVLMFRRKPLGRILITAGCVVTIVVGVASYVVLYAGGVGAPAGSFLMGGLGGLVGQVFPVITAILTLLPATGRWLAHVPGQSTGYPAPYPGPGVHPGYPVPTPQYVDPFRPNPAPYLGQPGHGAPYGGQPWTPYAGQPGLGATPPYPGQPGPGATPPYPGQPGPGASTPYPGELGPGTSPHAGQSGPGVSPPYPGQPGPGVTTPYTAQSGPGASTPYPGELGPGTSPHAGQSGPGVSAPYPGQPGPGASTSQQPTSDASTPSAGQPGPGAGQPTPAAGGAPRSPDSGATPNSNEPTPFPEVPPLGASEDQWRRPGN